ncbi:MAG: MATE family efflux transporter [Ruminococcus sp.]|nr:MATE family efflux transporter [Ruminococcus sp.]
MEISEKKKFNIQLKSLVLPMAFQQLMMAMVSVSDAFMIGFISQDALSAVSLAGQIQFVYSLFLYAIMSGVSIFAAQYRAIRDNISVEKILGIGLKISVLISLPFMFGAILFPEFLMKAFASDPVLISGGAEYLRVVGITYLLLSISQIYLSIMKNCGMASMSAVISSVSVVINIVFNALFIFVFDMGIKGAALATVISKAVEFAWVFVIMAKNKEVTLRIPYLLHNDKSLKHDFWKYTAPILGNEIVWGVGFTMYSVIMGHLGSDAAAANSIANIIKNLSICFCSGVANASGVMVGKQLGKNELDKAREYGSRLVKIAIFSGVIAGAMILCVLPFVPLISTLTPTARKYLQTMLIVCSYYVIGKSINMTVISGILPSGGDSKFGFICDAVTMWAIVVPIGLVCAFVLHLPVTLVYIIINIDEIIKLPVVYMNYVKYRWVKNLTKTQKHF